MINKILTAPQHSNDLFNISPENVLTGLPNNQ